MIGFVVNTRAGRGRGEAVWHTVSKLLQDRQIPYIFEETKYYGHATEIARSMAAAPGIESVVAIGGDGTVNETAQGLFGTDVPFGYIPAGSGNDYARGAGIPTQSDRALQKIIIRKTKTIDVGFAGDRIIVNTFGAGFDGEVAKANNTSGYKAWMNKLRLGPLSYAVAVVSTLVNYQPKHIKVNVDGIEQQFRNVWMVVAANIPYYGGGMKICPDAVHDDGRLNICIVHGLNRWQLLRFFPRVYRGTHISLPYVTFMNGEQLTIHCDQPLVCHVDGETIERNPETVRIVKNAFRIIE